MLLVVQSGEVRAKPTVIAKNGIAGQIECSETQKYASELIFNLCPVRTYKNITKPTASFDVFTAMT
jgi:hypothetical protein